MAWVAKEARGGTGGSRECGKRSETANRSAGCARNLTESRRNSRVRGRLREQQEAPSLPRAGHLQCPVPGRRNPRAVRRCSSLAVQSLPAGRRAAELRNRGTEKAEAGVQDPATCINFDGSAVSQFCTANHKHLRAVTRFLSQRAQRAKRNHFVKPSWGPSPSHLLFSAVSATSARDPLVLLGCGRGPRCGSLFPLPGGDQSLRHSSPGPRCCSIVMARLYRRNWFHDTPATRASVNAPTIIDPMSA
jgi:hypothetical protein